MKDKDIFEIVEINDWETLKRTLNDLDPNYIFRGQTKAKWDIKTTIERKSEKHLSLAERKMFTEFKKNIYNYDLRRIPESKLEILLFLQYFGAPTRLIDFSESFYIASFFALNEEYDGKSSIYAMNSTSLYSRLISFDDEKFSYLVDENLEEEDFPIPNFSDHEMFEEIILGGKNVKFVAAIRPMLHHERSNPQSSIHIAIGAINESFLTNIDNLLKNSVDDPYPQKPFVKYLIPNEIRKEALYGYSVQN